MIASFTTKLFTATLGDDQLWRVQLLDESFGPGYASKVTSDLNGGSKPGDETTAMEWQNYARRIAVESRALSLTYAGGQTFDMSVFLPVESPVEAAEVAEANDSPPAARRKPRKQLGSDSSGS